MNIFIRVNCRVCNELISFESNTILTNLATFSIQKAPFAAKSLNKQTFELKNKDLLFLICYFGFWWKVM